MASWDEIREKIKDAHEKIDSAYEKHVVSAVDIVKERPLLDNAVKTALPLIPIIGPTLSSIYDNIGGGTKSEEDKAKQILDFLGKLQQQDEEEFDRIAQELKANQNVIIVAINENRVSITDLISKTSAETIQAIRAIIEKRHPKPSHKDIVQRVITELEDRRVLYNLNQVGDAMDCRKSVQEIRGYLNNSIIKEEPLNLELDSDLAKTIKDMRTACREFLDTTQFLDKSKIITVADDDSTQAQFDGALERFRKTLGIIIRKLSKDYQVDVTGKLESILPPEPGEDV